MLVVLVFYTLFQNLTLYVTGAGFGLLSSIDLLDELILLGLTLSWVLRILVHNNLFRRTPLDWPVLLFAVYYVMSVLWHGVAPANALLGWRDAVFYVLLFYVLAQFHFSQSFLTRLVKWVMWTAYLQLAVLLVQWLVLVARTGSFLLEDDAVGLMGPSGSHKLGYFAGTLLLAYLGFFRERVYRRKGLILVLVATVLISSTRAALFWVPVALTVLLWRDLWRRRRVRMLWVGTVLLLLVMASGYMTLPETSRATLLPRKLYSQQMRTLQGRRFTRTAYLRYTWNVLQAEGSVLWGVGPGWYASKTASRLGSPYFESLPPAAAPGLSQIVTSLGEYGVVGLALIGFIYLTLLRYVARLSRKSPSPYLRGISAASVGTLLFYGLATSSSIAFEIQQVAIIPWLFAGSALAIARQLKQHEPVPATDFGSRRVPAVEVRGEETATI